MSTTIKATVMWAQLDQVNDMSGKYQVDLCQLSDAAVAKLESEGITVRTHEDKGSYITCKSKFPINVRDTDGVDLRGIKVGNGSECVAVIGAYEWKFKGKSGVSPSLDKFVITDLVVYEDNDTFEAPDLDEAL